MRRPRGCGGRFLNTKRSDSSKKTCGGQHLSHPTMSQSSEVLQSDSDNLTSPRDGNGNNRSNLSGSKVTSMFSRGDLNRFPFNNLQPSILSFSEIMNNGHGSMVMPSKWIAAAIQPLDSCCNLKVWRKWGCSEAQCHQCQIAVIGLHLPRLQPNGVGRAQEMGPTLFGYIGNSSLAFIALRLFSLLSITLFSWEWINRVCLEP